MTMSWRQFRASGRYAKVQTVVQKNYIIIRCKLLIHDYVILFGWVAANLQCAYFVRALQRWQLQTLSRMLQTLRSV